MFEFFKKALSEDNGNPSAMRVNTTIGFLQWSLVITFGFLWVLRFYPYLILAYLGTLAALTAGILGIKAWQKKNEEKVDSDAPTADAQ